ncbi:TAT-variant-translocated molybdopterin oxidoreductase [Winogradskyella sediminis]|uniref:Quinol:cytochrome c oxidoreductase iron-sulfur protein n=1 Tax=Winogradskyella sediminis TaxID=1382466 RepID=A0A1H1TK55_9FLAO|nr:TAT-variant-translocated molybdopterin oxidoreductase [Winogradskyella sediminis]REG88967.1 quinol:cytochrome c oxidoreductase iron-sulfur protein precursor [Winogradskyella sediminis]SDS60356.1 quinol:cytochrome c oxidoreductase iron-sulfur protein precursor [Winogradskyella sediminis]
MSSNKKYWKSVEELNENSSIVEALQQNEFVEEIPTDEFLGDKESLESSSTSRRDFLKYVGFSTAAASLAACEGPVIKSIPYIVQPTEIIPGVANYYATTIADGFDFASVLVKTREGRPIKIENNTDAASNGIANARVNASVLGLYDNLRVKSPMKGGSAISWDAFLSETTSKLKELNGKQIVLLTQSMPSPSTNKLIAEFKAKYGNVSHVSYDAVSESATLDAYQAKYGTRGMANYDFSKAMTIVSVGADFLGDWQGGGFESAYAKKRVPTNGKMSRHIQFESNMSLSGANADKRVPLTPSQQKLALAKLYSYVTGVALPGSLPEGLDKAVKAAAKELSQAGRNGVVVSGIQDVNAQTTVLEINEHLRSRAFDPDTTIKIRQGSNEAVAKLVADMKAGKVGAIIMNGVNPMYTLPNASDFKEGLDKTALSVAFSMKEDETASNCQYIAATPHNLESWGDFELKTGHYSMMQPTIRPLFDTKQFQEVLMSWTETSGSYRDYLKSVWTKSILNGASFNKAVQDGVFVSGSSQSSSSSTTTTSTSELQDKKDRTFLGGVIHDVAVGVGIKDEDKDVYKTTTTTSTVNNGVDTSAILTGGTAARALAASAKEGNLELSLYTKVGMGDGQQANNPWLQEFPDPITRASWDNYITVSQADAKAYGLVNENVANGGLNGSYVDVTVNGVTVSKVPVLIQPGQAKGSVGMAFGYGRTSKALKDEMKTGVNAYPLYQNFNAVQEVTISKVAGEHEFACVQLHNTLMGRGDIIKETTLEVFNTKDKKYWNAVPQVSLNHIETPVTSPEVDLWDEFDRSIGHHFNLSIDLNACTGCGACVIACHAENNVPVVGKSEMRRSRDMHWLRIDRYYSHQDTFSEDIEEKEATDGLGLGNYMFGDRDSDGSLSTFARLEEPADNPQVVFQPVMCQHCNHAPCETVCPVAATAHGRQGQNHMAYNRCVGTRYCANNCPYKVRRFNWFLYNKNDEFDYYMNDDLGRMVLNPDVVVRSRGVMEKCSMCIQKTQKTILDAKREGRPVKDGEFQTACSAACGNGAMVFGDVNDKDSKVSALKKDDRMYHLLEYVGTKPNVMYHTKVRNTSKA